VLFISQELGRAEFDLGEHRIPHLVAKSLGPEAFRLSLDPGLVEGSGHLAKSRKPVCLGKHTVVEMSAGYFLHELCFAAG
jgi:hypothetical protein